MYASLFSHTETVLYLMQKKADLDLKNPSGKTPLMLASLCGSEETLKLLLQVVGSAIFFDFPLSTGFQLTVAWSQSRRKRLE